MISYQLDMDYKKAYNVNCYNIGIITEVDLYGWLGSFDPMADLRQEQICDRSRFMARYLYGCISIISYQLDIQIDSSIRLIRYGL